MCKPFVLAFFITPRLTPLNRTFASTAPSTATFAVAKQFGVDPEVTILITSLFVVGYVLGPLLWSGLSETYGRRPIFVATLFIYTISILGQALGKNLATILVTRFLSGLFASAPLTNGGGFLADVWDTVGRGPAVAVYSASMFIGPIVGPIIGAFVVPSRLGWRWVFWITMIVSGVCWILCVLLLPETFHPVLLQQRAKKLRKADPVKNKNKYTALDKQESGVKAILERTIFRPFHMLFLEPILLLITIYTGVVYGLIFALFELFPIIFNETRHIPIQYSGLFFIGTGIGAAMGAYYTCWEGRKYVDLVKKWKGFPPPEQRLNGAMYGGPLLVIAIFWVGWAGAYKNVHWIVAELGTIPLGMGMALIFICFIVSLSFHRHEYPLTTYLFSRTS
jgi:DHA1 family multidrug resistance protein-like MFS transporter